MSTTVQDQGMTEIVEEWMKSLIHENGGTASKPPLDPAEFAAKMAISHLLNIYKLTVHVARAEQDMDKTAQIWEVMSGICDSFSRDLGKLNCGTCACKDAMDTILDIRNRCIEIRDLHRKA